MSDTAVYTIYTDGAARGNPGPAAFAYVITRDGATVAEDSGCLGRTTNNVAEYTALLRALERAQQLGAENVIVHSDSELMVKQMKGEYQVKHPDLRALYQQARELCNHFRAVSLVHVRRKENSRADRLCNEALDGSGPRSPSAPPKKVSSTGPTRDQVARAEAVDCLRAAATAWKRGDPEAPSPEDVCDQLWSILQEQGLIR
jgi:ribonuclease HI